MFTMQKNQQKKGKNKVLEKMKNPKKLYIQRIVVMNIDEYFENGKLDGEPKC